MWNLRPFNHTQELEFFHGFLFEGFMGTMLYRFLKTCFLQDLGANAEGMGLGLAVVLEIVQMHQGSIKVESGEPCLFFFPKKEKNQRVFFHGRKVTLVNHLRSQVGKGSSFIISLSCLDDEFCRLDFFYDMIFEDGPEHFDENTSIAEKGDFRSLRSFLWLDVFFPR